LLLHDLLLTRFAVDGVRPDATPTPWGRELPWADALGFGFNPGMIAGRACAVIRICYVEESNFS
jgi:hypothetical protein